MSVIDLVFAEKELDPVAKMINEMAKNSIIYMDRDVPDEMRQKLVDILTWIKNY